MGQNKKIMEQYIDNHLVSDEFDVDYTNALVLRGKLSKDELQVKKLLEYGE